MVCGQYAPHSTVLTINHDFVLLIALPVVGNTDDRQEQATATDMEESVEDGDPLDVPQESETLLPVATGQPLTRDFRSLHACVTQLTDEAVSDVVVDKVPRGVKENMWFLVRGHVTADRADKFRDDCGAWSQHHGWKSYHLRDSLTKVHLLDDGSYGSCRRVDGKRVTVRMDPQPTDVLCVHRMHTKLARDSDYKRRITYIDGIPMYVAEYLGRFPTAVESHGNATKSSGEYVRMRPQVLDAVVQQVNATKDKPRKVYQHQHLEGDGDAARNVKQVTNAAQCGIPDKEFR